MDSILTSIKKILGIAEEYEHFDDDLIIHINSVLSILNQIGVGPTEGFSIENKSDKWSDFISMKNQLGMVKTYTALKVKQIFDPPLSSAVSEAINKTISELEWRILHVTDLTESKKEENQNG